MKKRIQKYVHHFFINSILTKKYQDKKSIESNEMITAFFKRIKQEIKMLNELITNFYIQLENEFLYIVVFAFIVFIVSHYINKNEKLKEKISEFF